MEHAAQNSAALKPAEHHIPVTRTARYYTLGEINQNTKDIWIFIHGHRDLAGRFIMKFAELADKGSFLFAPEALMRQYIKGEYGDIGASWMTKEDREADIKDYVSYLDRLFFDEIEPKAKQYNLKINALGFSQGAATLSRWLALGKAKIDKAVFWCGTLGHDVDYSKAENLKQTEIHQVFASNDPYYDAAFPPQQTEILTKVGITPKTFTFNGGHEVSAELMKEAKII
jgi:predicted esterase